MKIFILDDDQSIIRILEQIINEKGIGNIIGTSTNSVKAMNEIVSYEPDIVIMDLLMPGLDGITLVERVREFNKTIKFIMISQVISKELISKAYENGVTFYITKPINAVEVLNVLGEVITYIEADKRLNLIKHVFQYDSFQYKDELSIKANIEHTLKSIGVINYSVTQEIAEIVEYMNLNYEETKALKLKEIFRNFNSNPKTVEQRIRRTAMVGLENLAYIGIEDNLNDNFLEFSNTLYNFKDVKIEMDFIRGQSQEHGKVNIRKFLDGLQYYINR